MTAIRRAMMSAAGQAGDPLYVEDVFSTYLYEGNGSTQTITNGIDLDGEGGMIWQKSRSNATNHYLVDTVRGAGDSLNSDTTAAAANGATDEVTGWNSDGYGITASGSIYSANVSGQDYVSWSFRKAPGFFDVVTYTGDGVAGRTVSHNLGSAPGCIIIKQISSAGNAWRVYHRAIDPTAPEDYYLELNATDARADVSGAPADGWNGTAPTSTEFTLGSFGAVNANTSEYVAYLFAHDDQSFGAGGDESIIKCGTFTTDGSGNATVSLGWEAQYVMCKRTNTTGNWYIQDVMRGGLISNGTSGSPTLLANTSGAESAAISQTATADGFTFQNSGIPGDYIYIAIRRPMKVPESGTEVYGASTYTGNASSQVITSSFADMTLIKPRGTTSYNDWILDTLLTRQMLKPNLTATDASYTIDAWNSSTFTIGNSARVNASGVSYVVEYFKRAPGFMDVVCYTGTGSAHTEAHGLSVVPELMIVKDRDTAYPWAVYNATIGGTKGLNLNTTAAAFTSSGYWNDTAPTSTVFTVGTSIYVSTSADKYVAYLFATLADVSKVGSYTADATLTTIDCGFTAGARFVLIKRTDAVGDWYVYDSTRGIVAGSDPYLLLNSTAAEVTYTDYIDPDNSGFQLTAAGSGTINIDTAEYIYLAIA